MKNMFIRLLACLMMAAMLISGAAMAEMDLSALDELNEQVQAEADRLASEAAEIETVEWTDANGMIKFNIPADWTELDGELVTQLVNEMLSSGALDVAKKNAHALNVDVALRHGNLFKAVGKEKFDLIASNPPYIPTAEVNELQAEVQHEPALALDGGADGLDFYRRIAEQAPAHLNQGGSIYLEVGMGEAGDVLDLLRARMDGEDSGIIKDLCGIDRIVWIRSK